MSEMAQARASIPARHVAAVVMGNALEFYDFLTYSFFAIYIGRTFFPSTSPMVSLLASLATFGVGFVTRPIGGIVIGRMGDRLGRKPAMMLSFWLMGASIIGLALTPSHAKIGVVAPVLVVFFRMVQGFALGGEVGPSTAFLLEAAPPERRGFYAAFQSWSQSLSILAAGLVGFGLANLLSEQQLQDYGWRIAFLIGAAIVPFGLMVRRSLPETLHSAEREESERVSVRPYLWTAFIGLVLLANGTVATYICGYMTTYALATLHMHASVAFGATILNGVCGLSLALVSGGVSDRIGRIRMMLVPSVFLLFLIFPAFRLIAHYRTTAALLGASAVLMCLHALSVPQSIIWLTESLPKEIRCGGVAIVYAFAISIFGGSTQYVVTWLIHVTGNPLAPAWYWTIASVIGIVAMLAARESAPCKVGETGTLVAPLPVTAISVDPAS